MGRVDVKTLRAKLRAIGIGRFVTVAGPGLHGMLRVVVMDTHAKSYADLVLDPRPIPRYTGHTPTVGPLPRPRGFTAPRGMEFPR